MEKCKECGCIIHDSSTRRQRIEQLIKTNSKYDGLLEGLCVTCLHKEQVKIIREKAANRLKARAEKMKKLQERTKKIEDAEAANE